MTAILLQLAPMFFFFGIGVWLKKSSLAEQVHGEFLLRLVFFVTLPLLVLLSLSKTPLSTTTAMLPLAHIAVNSCCLLTALFCTRLLSLERKTVGAMLVSTSMANNAFMFPYILTVYGQTGLSDAILFDFGNAIMTSTFAYAVAYKYSDQQHNRWAMLRKIVKSPLVLALALGVLLAAIGIPIPGEIELIVKPVAQMTGPLILIAMGIIFSLKIGDLRLVTLTVAIRMVLGLVFGVGIATLFGFEGITFIVVCLCAAGPIGFTAMTYAYLARLDTQLSSSAVSISILVGLIYIPVLILIFGSP